jgi:hypothetical protein
MKSKYSAKENIFNCFSIIIITIHVHWHFRLTKSALNGEIIDTHVINTESLYAIVETITDHLWLYSFPYYLLEKDGQKTGPYDYGCFIIEHLIYLL